MVASKEIRSLKNLSLNVIRKSLRPNVWFGAKRLGLRNELQNLLTLKGNNGRYSVVQDHDSLQLIPRSQIILQSHAGLSISYLGCKGP